MIIDTHQHFWRYSAEEYGWIDQSMSAIAQDFLPADLVEETRRVGVDGVVTVQARQTLDETRWLLALADEHPLVRGVVGWVPLAAPDCREQLKVLDHPRLKGVRHVVHDEPDDQFILGGPFNDGVALLEEFDLAYDILVFERHLPQTIEFVDRHPDGRFVLDHIAKPKIAAGEIEPWRSNIQRLAERHNVACKVSGLVTEASWEGWTPEDLSPYLDTVLDAFGPERLMFGSDWPVCRLASDYERWFHVVQRWAEPLSASERGRLMGGAAIEWYRLEA